jgi:hypothetical protein
MNNLITSMYAQTLYMLGMGLGFLLIPNVILPLFGLNPTNEVWIRVLGALATGFAGYYYAMIQQKNITYFWATVWGRYWFCACLAVLAFLHTGLAPLYLFAMLETGLAVWAHLALRQVGKNG